MRSKQSEHLDSPGNFFYTQAPYWSRLGWVAPAVDAVGVQRAARIVGHVRRRSAGIYFSPGPRAVPPPHGAALRPAGLPSQHCNISSATPPLGGGTLAALATPTRQRPGASQAARHNSPFPRSPPISFHFRASGSDSTRCPSFLLFPHYRPIMSRRRRRLPATRPSRCREPSPQRGPRAPGCQGRVPRAAVPRLDGQPAKG